MAGEGTRHGTGRRHGPDIFLSIIVVLDFQSNPTTCISAAGGLYPALPLIDFQACLAGNPRQAHAGTWPRARAVLPCPCHYCHFLTYHLASLCISDVTLWYRFSQSHRCANDWGFSLRWNWVYLSTVSILIGSVLHTATRTCQGGLDAMHQCEKTSQPHVTLPFFKC